MTDPSTKEGRAALRAICESPEIANSADLEQEPVSSAEATFLHEQDWSSGFGWQHQLDWYWTPSNGPDIWIEDDPEKMHLWLEDRAAYRRQVKEDHAREHAVELFTALPACLDRIEAQEAEIERQRGELDELRFRFQPLDAAKRRAKGKQGAEG